MMTIRLAVNRSPGSHLVDGLSSGHNVFDAESMKVMVQLESQLRLQAGVEYVNLELPANCSVEIAIEEIQNQFHLKLLHHLVQPRKRSPLLTLPT